MTCSYYTFRQNDYYCQKKGDYVNDDVYFRYCRNYSYDECPIYKGDPSGGCYLTSACTCAKGMPDDCHELQVLRNFRDNWLAGQEGGLDAITRYYAVAPKVVEAVNSAKGSREAFDAIYEELVAPCVKLIEQGRNEEAFKLYQGMTLQLEQQYC